jgi:hypothetical protein
MKKLLITLAALLITGAASAQSNAIEGSWGIQQSQNGFIFDLTFAISHDSITLTNVCSGNGAQAKASVTVASSYTDTTLTVRESRKDQQSNAGLNCDVNAQQGSMNYTVQGNQLILTYAGSDVALVLTHK